MQKKLERQIRDATKQVDSIEKDKKSTTKYVTKIVPSNIKNKHKRQQMVAEMKAAKQKKKTLERVKKKQIKLEKGEDAVPT